MVGSRETLEENPIFHGKIYGFRLRFSLFCQPIDPEALKSELGSKETPLQRARLSSHHSIAPQRAGGRNEALLRARNVRLQRSGGDARGHHVA